ncbi:MAG TPA: glycosyltransferase family 2 protein [Thermoanaerobaculia bacterium]|jgi:undecaprenyl-phosphate 4-deoxy-4-formamido-L-arabinose transferase|nr:glycosyltransferase family 2 protein [Thermoanaerobaculia bacterium]
MAATTAVSIVIPVYNSADVLPVLCERLAPVLPALGEGTEVVFVNDGSRDRSWEVLQELAAARPWMRCLDLMRNYGQHNALLCGIREARGGVVVTMDDDLQHPPEEIPRLLAHLEGRDVVYGRPDAEHHGLWRDLASQLTKLALQSAMGVEAARNVSAFRAFRTELREAFKTDLGPFVSIDVLLTWGTTRFGSVTVRHEPRRIGTSSYTLRKLVTHALNMMTGFGTLPLQLASVIGFVFTLFGMGVLAYVIGRYLIQGGSVPGFPFLASIIAIFSGAQLFALGILGEYLARMHFRLMEKPAYVVRRSLEAGK